MRGSIHTALLDRVESKAFYLNISSPLTDWLQPLSHHWNIACLAIFYYYFHANCSSNLNSCMPPPVTSLYKMFFFLSILFCSTLMQNLTSTFNHSSLSLVNSGTHHLLLYFHLPFIWIDLRNTFQDLYSILLANSLSLSLSWACISLHHFTSPFCSLASFSFSCTKKVGKNHEWKKINRKKLI